MSRRGSAVDWGERKERKEKIDRVSSNMAGRRRLERPLAWGEFGYPQRRTVTRPMVGKLRACKSKCTIWLKRADLLGSFV